MTTTSLVWTKGRDPVNGTETAWHAAGAGGRSYEIVDRRAHSGVWILRLDTGKVAGAVGGFAVAETRDAKFTRLASAKRAAQRWEDITTAAIVAPEPAQRVEPVTGAAAMTVAKKATRAPRTRTPRKISDLSERERAQIGPLVAKRKGTAEWCWQAVELLKDRIRYVEDDWRKVQDVIDMLKAEEAWKTIPPEKPYGTFAALLREELGLSEEQIDEQIRNDGLAPIGPKGVDTTTTTTTPYRDAAITLWGDAGAYVHDAYRRHLHLFPELPDELPIVIGLTAYGKCSGLTRGGWEHGPRISVASNLFAKGARVVDDLLVHEMLHAQLHITGRNTKHDSADWYEAIQRLSPAVLGHEIDVRRGAGRKSVRVVDADGVSRVRKVKVAEHEGMHDKVSRWPSPFRPIGYDWGAPIDCPSY